MSNYNISGLSEANDLLELAVAVNGVTGEMFFTVVTMLVLVVAFISMKQFDSSVAFASASFISTFLTAILWAVGLVSEYVLLVHFVLFVIAIAINRL